MSPTTAAWPHRMGVRAATAALAGIVLGLGLSRIGFTDDAEFHRMLRFVELRLFLTFCTAVGVAGLGLFLLRGVVRLPERQIHKGSIAGGVVFGVGWALCGACPSVAFTQLGEGRWWATATVAGLVLGARVYPRVHERYFRFSRGDCNS